VGSSVAGLPPLEHEDVAVMGAVALDVVGEDVSVGVSY
jgi:hypothetical protein